MKKITISLVYKHLFINWVKVRHNVIHCTSKCVLDTIYIISTRAWSAPQFSSVSQSCLTLCNPMRHSTPGLPVHHQLPEYTQTYVYWISDAIQPSHPLSSPLPLPSIFPSISIFSNESALCIRWLKSWNFSFNITPSLEDSGLISFRMDWLDLPAVQETLESPLQHHSSKTSILWRSAFNTVQLSI